MKFVLWVLGAHGYFEVTHDITKYCRAKIFEKIGKKTPMFARFSTVSKHIFIIQTKSCIHVLTSCLGCTCIWIHAQELS